MVQLMEMDAWKTRNVLKTRNVAFDVSNSGSGKQASKSPRHVLNVPAPQQGTTTMSKENYSGHH